MIYKPQQGGGLGRSWAVGHRKRVYGRHLFNNTNSIHNTFGHFTAGLINEAQKGLTVGPKCSWNHFIYEKYETPPSFWLHPPKICSVHSCIHSSNSCRLYQRIPETFYNYYVQRSSHEVLGIQRQLLVCRTATVKAYFWK